MKRVFGQIIILGIAISACSKTGGSEEDNPHLEDQSDDIFPVITITKPALNQVYYSGDSIIVEGNATDNKTMYKGKLSLSNDNSGAVVAENLFETHFLQTLSFRLAYKATVSTSTDFTINAEFQDHGLNVSIKTLKVKVNP